MLLRPFDYAVPASLQEAIGLLREKGGAVPLAGGHSLLVEMKLGRISPAFLVDLRQIADLRTIEHASGRVSIGAMVTHDEIGADAAVCQALPALADAIDQLSDPEVRNRATLGGSLARNDPAADLPAAVLALDAGIVIAGSGGTRSVPAAAFFTDAFKTALQPGEVISRITFAVGSPAVGSAYEKARNAASGYALCGVAAWLQLSSGGNVEACRVSATGVDGCAVRLTAVEMACAGEAATPEAFAAAAARCGEGVALRSDMFASADYRVHLCALLATTALNRAFDRAKKA